MPNSPATQADVLELCERAIRLAALQEDGQAWVLSSQRCDLPSEPCATYAATAPDARCLLWQGENWLLGYGASAECRAEGPGRSIALAAAAADLRARCVCNGPLVGPVLLAQLCFEERRPGGAWCGQPAARLLLPRRLLWRRDGHGWQVDAIAVRAGDDAAATAERLAAEPARTPTRNDAGQPWAEPALPCFRELVADVLPLLEHGALRKIVLATAVDECLPEPVTATDMLERLHAQVDECGCVYACDVDGGASFLGATPEMLFTLDDQRCRCMSLAGTRPRGADPAEDDALAAELHASTKERKEHQLVIEHLAHRLRPRAGRVSVPEHPGLRRLPRIQHLESLVEAELREPDAFDLLQALFPTPAVAGLPVEPARDYLARHEGLARGLYSGAIGYFCGSHAHFVVPLRGALVHERRARLFAGAGIVETSDPDAEVKEVELKLEPMRRVLRA